MKIIPHYGDVNDPKIRAKYGYLEATVSIIGNFLLFIMKLLLGIFINSISLIADAFHTLSDVGTSGVVIFGFKMAKKPPDKEHPFGHGRIEYIAALIIAVLLVVVGIGFIEESIERIINSVTIINREFALIIGVVVIITAVAKELMARFSYSIAKKIKSDMLVGDAWHHRSDALTSIGVGVGIIGSAQGFPILDPIFGITVSVIIIYVGIDLFKKTSNMLIGHAPDDEIVEKIENIAKSLEEIEGTHKINVHDYGTSKVISLHAEVKNNLKLDEAHKIADDLERKIRRRLNYPIIIHIDPKETPKDEIISHKIIQSILENQKEIISFHKIQIIRGGTKNEIKMHIIVDKDMPVEDSHKLCHNVQSSLQTVYGSCNADIHLEPCQKDCMICTLTCNKRLI